MGKVRAPAAVSCLQLLFPVLTSQNPEQKSLSLHEGEQTLIYQFIFPRFHTQGAIKEEDMHAGQPNTHRRAEHGL